MQSHKPEAPISKQKLTKAQIKKLKEKLVRRDTLITQIPSEQRMLNLLQWRQLCYALLFCGGLAFLYPDIVRGELLSSPVPSVLLIGAILTASSYWRDRQKIGSLDMNISSLNDELANINKELAEIEEQFLDVQILVASHEAEKTASKEKLSQKEQPLQQEEKQSRVVRPPMLPQSRLTLAQRKQLARGGRSALSPPPRLNLQLPPLVEPSPPAESKINVLARGAVDRLTAASAVPKELILQIAELFSSLRSRAARKSQPRDLISKTSSVTEVSELADGSTSGQQKRRRRKKVLIPVTPKESSEGGADVVASFQEADIAIEPSNVEQQVLDVSVSEEAGGDKSNESSSALSSPVEDSSSSEQQVESPVISPPELKMPSSTSQEADMATKIEPPNVEQQVSCGEKNGLHNSGGGNGNLSSPVVASPLSERPASPIVVAPSPYELKKTASPFFQSPKKPSESRQHNSGNESEMSDAISHRDTMQRLYERNNRKLKEHANKLTQQKDLLEKVLNEIPYAEPKNREDLTRQKEDLHRTIAGINNKIEKLKETGTIFYRDMCEAEQTIALLERLKNEKGAQLADKAHTV